MILFFFLFLTTNVVINILIMPFQMPCLDGVSNSKHFFPDEALGWFLCKEFSVQNN